MLARLGRGLLWAAIGYAIGGVATYGLTMSLSPNSHDRSLEATMTAAFVVGPLSALVGLVAGVTRRSGSGRRGDQP